MITDPLQKKAYDAMAAALPFAIDASKVTVEPGLSYCKSTINVHDYAVGLMAAFGSVVDRIGAIRGLPAQTMKLSRRRAGLLLNSMQMHFVNGYSTMFDAWPIGPDNGTYRAKDGRHITMIGLHPHLRDGLLSYFDCANSQSAIQAAVEKKPAQQIEDEVAKLNLALGMVRTPEEWAAHPQGQATVKRPMVDIHHKGGTGGRKLGNARHRPLEGVRVIELSHIISAPMIGRLLAEQGAEVIKVQPPRGDWIAPVWLDVSWGKKNIFLDIKSAYGRARFEELLGSADVLLSGQRRDALPRIGLDDAALRAINPGLIYAREDCFADDTPWAGRRGFEQIAQAVTGVEHLNSEGLAEPTVVSSVMNDTLTAYMGATGIVAALAEREQNGGFWTVDASLSRCSTMATDFYDPQPDSKFAPVTMQDMIDHGIDQITPWGVHTRIGAAVEFSHTPSMAIRPTSWPGTDSDTTGWSELPAGESAPQLPHYPSKLARNGGIRNLISCYGIEDRGDGGGRLGFASKG